MVQLFFDDDGLFSRVNTVRKYGNPELIKDAVYYDGLCSTDYCTCDVFKTDDGIITYDLYGKNAGRNNVLFYGVQYGRYTLFAGERCR